MTPNPDLEQARAILAARIIAVLERRNTPVERFVDRALSLATTWGGRVDRPPEGLADDVRRALLPHADDGVVREVVEGRATIAWRPGETDWAPRSSLR